MLLVLYPTLRAADADSNTWLERKAALRIVTIDGSEQDLPFLFPFRERPIVAELVAFQWPAFFVARLVVPVPTLESGQRKPNRLTLASYVFISTTVALYWMVIGAWTSKRLFVASADPLPKPFRLVLKALVAPVGLLFLLLLAKDIVHGGWPEGANGAYGVTAWLALALVFLSAEAGWIGSRSLDVRDECPARSRGRLRACTRRH